MRLNNNTYHIQCTLLGLFSFLIAFTLNAQTDSTYWKLSLEDLSNTKISTGTRHSSNLSDIPGTIRIIDEEEIECKGYFTLEQVLADLPGFQFRDIQGFNTYTFLRGIPNQNNYVLILINGIPVNEINSGGFYGGGQYNLNNIDQIEVIYGPSSILYGTNAFTGVINIITKKPVNNEGIELNSGYGSYNSFYTDANYSVFNDEKNIGFTISGMFKHTDKLPLQGNLGDNNWTDDMENYETDQSFNSEFVVKDFIFGADYLSKTASRTTKYQTVGSKYQDYGTNWDIRFLNLYAKHQHQFNDDNSVNTKLYFRDATVLPSTIGLIEAADSLNSGRQVRYYRPNQTAGLDISFANTSIKNLKYTIGITNEYERISNGFSTTSSDTAAYWPDYPLRPEMLDNYLISGYFQGFYKIVDAINVYFGGRFDQSTVYNNVFTPTGGFTYSNNKIISKLIYSEAFRAPKNWDYTYGAGNENLKPEKIQAIEFSNLIQLNKYMRLDLSIFNNYINNGLEIDQVNNIWVNSSKKTVSGVEAMVQTFSEYGSLNASYTYTISSDANGDKLPEISPHVITADYSIKLKNKILFGINLKYFDKKPTYSALTTTGKGYVESAYILSSRIRLIKIQGFSLILNANNLLDEIYYHTSNTMIERYRQPGRNFMITIKYKPVNKL